MLRYDVYFEFVLHLLFIAVATIYSYLAPKKEEKKKRQVNGIKTKLVRSGSFFFVRLLLNNKQELNKEREKFII